MPNYIQEFIYDMKKKNNLKIEKWEPNKVYYPEYMLLGGDRGILAYIYFLDEGPLMLDDIVNKVSRAESELDRPVFFIRKYQDLKQLYFETNEQIKARLLDGYSGVNYIPDMMTIGHYEELVSTFNHLKKNGIKFY